MATAGSTSAGSPLGELDEFPEGQTRLAKFENPISGVADGETDRIPCWVRRVQGEQFQVFAVNCAHLGCPVRWFAQSGLFMCPCHGGVYYQDGSRASGPPPRGLFEYPYKVEDGKLLIEAGTTADIVHHGEPGREEERMSRLEKIADWFDQRLHLGGVIRETMAHPVPRKSASWWYVFGSAALTLFILQVVTGIMLALIYVPSAAEAWNSLQYLNHGVTLGWFLRAVHGWGSNFMVAVVLIHLCQDCRYFTPMLK